MIAAAGNCAESLSCPVKYPAAYPAVMAVAATGYYDTRAYYSAVGPQIELAAPGGDGVTGLFSTWSLDAALQCGSSFQLIDGGAYCDKPGTSMAAAVTTGVAALTWSLRPELSAEQVRDILTKSARPIAGLPEQVGHGLVDAEKAARDALHSELSVSPAVLNYRLPTGSAPFTAELLLANPSLEPMQWVITGTQQIPWLTVNAPVSGTVRYGQPVRAGLTISPTHVLSGTYRSSFWVEGNRDDGGRVLLPVQANLQVYTPTQEAPIYLPAFANAAHQPSGGLFVDFTWEMPDASGRTPYVLTDNSSIGITLPLTITTGGVAYRDARIYSDGAVALPASAAIGAPSGGCLPRVTPSGPVAFGWGADLNPGATGAQVSGFRAGPDRFVVEYLNVPAAPAQTAYRVSFQIVLYSDGKVGLNYLAAPSAAGTPPHVIAGVQARDGRFYNQLACVTAAAETGTIPRAYQSMLFGEGNLF